MGVITRLYHRSEGLTDNRYNVFFLDMGENIHIHYRDLRIELSVDEFVEFSGLIEGYIPQIRGEIDRGYKDGVRPNTNQLNTLSTFSNKSPLRHAIRYHPNRVSIEENLDGYHVHIRNYKLLLDRPSFLNFIHAAREALDKREAEVGLDETLALIDVNELVHDLGPRGQEDGKEYAVVTVDKAYFSKARQLLDGLKYTVADQTQDALVYEKGDGRIYLKSAGLPSSGVLRTFGSPLVPLSDYLNRNAKRFTPEEFNLIKLQYLDKYFFVKKNALEGVVELDYLKLIFDSQNNCLIFPSKSGGGSINIKRQYDAFMLFLKDLGLSFVKPGKIPYSESENGRIKTVFDGYVSQYLAKQPCVNKVYLFGGPAKKRSGRYQVPFVHFDWAKLGSDFDILIEIDERFEMPAGWEYKFFNQACGSDYYHLGDINYPIASDYIEKFPNIAFRHHLVEAYLYFGSKGNRKAKDDYLKKFNATLLYQKGGEKRDKETDELLKDFVRRGYGIEPQAIERLNVPSFNEIYRVRTADKSFAAKIMGKGDFTPAAPGHSGQHLAYEAQLLDELARLDAPVVAPIAGLDGKSLLEFDTRFCMLFPYLESDSPSPSPALMADLASRSLATVHEVLAKSAVPADRYRFHEACNYWQDQFVTLHEKFTNDDRRIAEFKAMIPEIGAAGQSILSAEGLVRHSVHGDVCPRNFFYVGGTAYLFDFQVAHYGPRIEDVAEGALEFALEGGRVDGQRLQEFIAGYEATSPLAEAEREMLPTMLRLQACFKLARAFRVQVVFGYKVDEKRVTALLDYLNAAA